MRPPHPASAMRPRKRDNPKYPHPIDSLYMRLPYDAMPYYPQNRHELEPVTSTIMKERPPRPRVGFEPNTISMDGPPRYSEILDSRRTSKDHFAPHFSQDLSSIIRNPTYNDNLSPTSDLVSRQVVKEIRDLTSKHFSKDNHKTSINNVGCQTLTDLVTDHPRDYQQLSRTLTYDPPNNTTNQLPSRFSIYNDNDTPQVPRTTQMPHLPSTLGRERSRDRLPLITHRNTEIPNQSNVTPVSSVRRRDLTGPHLRDHLGPREENNSSLLYPQTLPPLLSEDHNNVSTSDEPRAHDIPAYETTYDVSRPRRGQARIPPEFHALPATPQQANEPFFNRASGVFNVNPINDSTTVNLSQNNNSDRLSLGRMKEKKIANFDGKTDFGHYMVQFRLAAHLNQWTKQEMALQLATSLTGDARGALVDSMVNNTLDFDTLVTNLENQFDPKNMADSYKNQLQARRWKHNEPLTELHRDINRLMRKAYPNFTDDIRQELAVEHFKRALNDKETELFVVGQNPADLASAVKAATAFQTFRQTREKPAIRVCQNFDSDTDTTDDISEANMDAFCDIINKIADNAKRLPPDQCAYCEKPGHFWRDCALFKRHVKERPDSPCVNFVPHIQRKYTKSTTGN